MKQCCFTTACCLPTDRVVESSGANPERVCLGEGILCLRSWRILSLAVTPGEAYHIDIDAGEQVFGVADDDNSVIFPLSDFPADIEPVVGVLVEFDLPHGGVSAGRVVRVEDQEVLVDFNHPLIGKNVSYEIKIVAVQPGSKRGRNDCGQIRFGTDQSSVVTGQPTWFLCRCGPCD